MVGPGSYGQLQDYSSKYEKNLDEGNSYVIKDNGHFNQRPQLYAAAKGARDAAFMSQAAENPGPGSYETNTSGFVDNQTIRGLRQMRKSPSPRNNSLGGVMVSNPSLAGSHGGLKN